MRLRVIREPVAHQGIMGALYLEGVWQMWTLEPAEKAIPAGTYPVTLYFSPKRGLNVPLLHDVPGRSFIEIHVGNWISDSDGCILVGYQRANSAYVGSSKPAFAGLMAALNAATDPITIRVEDAEP